MLINARNVAFTFTKIFVTIFLVLASRSALSADWVRFSAARPSDRPGVPFGLLSTEDGQKSGLSADGWYRYIVGRAPVTLHGKREGDNMFRPKVTYEVAIEGRTKWKEIRSEIEQRNDDTITLDPKHPGVGVVINMEPFRGSIGVYRYGRLILENGDSTIFVIDDLLPPMAESESGDGDFKLEIMQSEKEKRADGFTDQWLTEPASLAAVTSMGGRVIGDFVYSNRTKAPIKLSGFRTPDGDFWPTAVLQVGSGNNEWKTIGRSGENGTATALEIESGKAERIRIFLSEYKPLTDKYRFGKALFSDGTAGIFSLKFLKGQNALSEP